MEDVGPCLSGLQIGIQADLREESPPILKVFTKYIHLCVSPILFDFSFNISRQRGRKNYYELLVGL